MRKSKDSRDNEAVLHLYGQSWWHDNARIIGNLNGLTALRDLLNEIIEKRDEKEVSGEFYVVDGESYSINILWSTANDMDELKLPYTDEMFDHLYGEDNELHSTE